jgi:DUF4097 and DUF4098 domain-containing protein YvlB
MQKFAALTLLALLTATPAGAAQKETENVDRTIPFAQGGRLRLKNFSGDVRITPSMGTDVVIHAVRRATRDRLENIKLDIRVEGTSIDIEANRRAPGYRERDDNVVETTFDIQVPTDTELDVNIFSGDVSIENIEGRQKLHSFSGALTVKGGTGPVEAETFSGEIELDLSLARDMPSVEAKTFSGDIKARLPQTGGGRVEFSGFSGHFDSQLPLTLHGTSRRNVTADLGSGGNARLRFNTFSGSVQLLK